MLGHVDVRKGGRIGNQAFPIFDDGMKDAAGFHGVVVVRPREGGKQAKRRKKKRGSVDSIQLF